MFPEDRVLVGVINRKRDLEVVQQEGWYRIPQSRMPRGVNAEYLAFFLSKAFKELNGSIPYYAERKGLELAYRRDLLPKEADHPRAGEVYYKVQLGELISKTPPIQNVTKRRLGFIYTTWDRFVKANVVADLYSKDDYFVDRVFYALRGNGILADRTWSAEYKGVAPELRVLCQSGPFVASTSPSEGQFFLDGGQEPDDLLAKILDAIARQGGPVFLSIPLDE